jgi:hypothetical protein
MPVLLSPSKNEGMSPIHADGILARLACTAKFCSRSTAVVCPPPRQLHTQLTD